MRSSGRAASAEAVERDGPSPEIRGRQQAHGAHGLRVAAAVSGARPFAEGWPALAGAEPFGGYPGAWDSAFARNLEAEA
eukprot:4352836-Pyramimonas_sp.AAC.1